MKIKEITIWKEDLALTRPYTIAYETISAVENVFVLLETDNGITGIGAGSPAEDVTGETITATETALSLKLAPILQGKDIRSCFSLLKELNTALADTPAALAAADIALHDLAAKTMGLPLVDLLGRVHDRLPTSITIGIMPVKETLAEAEEYLGRGFSILKIKTGLNVEEDIERIIRLNETFKSKICMRVDANQGYEVEELHHFFKKTVGLVEFIEQPLKAEHLEKMGQLPQAIRRVSAADETLLGPRDAAQMLHAPRPFGIFNIKLMKCGGIAPGLEIANMAGHADIDLMWGCMDESIVSIAGALHAAFSSRATRYLDLDGSLDLARDIVNGGFILENGWMRTTDQPGLGVKRI
ncbi:chloromuconate cycloisomerase-like protein [Desulforapulum autotrophicum HRM2]|uniref:L-Lys-D/L-Arg epimerase n=1 Tax=Desulforapulum autotrophicum (strain ATCC 43914 / DSM 3382 / VKM B-1955 / HRM2) TaxID=177437 RepID=KRDE_DESAH|nr:dipeptide epimerase [Desulforapulum autotrophicum]C0QM06.1 RecName: Full=L-Lys-D/L-Arg epimerase; AltName: Full=Cationic dipeptide epimerase [Desulforapulum autotrophicum HRM2]ACN14312.1 chloromuconate cycloisomerase-like protein [Desulforapulum autotrophicum HRM2]